MVLHKVMSDTFSLRMRDLVEQATMPASTIRFYLQQGMLPEPRRPTPSSALYGEHHLAALRALKRMKALAPELPIVQLKRIMKLVQKGVEPEVALELHRSVSYGVNQQSVEVMALSEDALAAEANVDATVVTELIKLGILIPLAGEVTAPYNQADIEVVRAVKAYEAMSATGIDKVARIARLLREVSAIEMEMRNTVSDNKSPEEAAAISAQLQAWANFWHAYQFSRLRLSEIANYGLGKTVSTQNRNYK